MEGKQVGFANRFKISQFGLAFLQQLPAELRLIQANQDLQMQKGNSIINSQNTHLRRRELDFFAFANQTQNLIKRQKRRLFRVMEVSNSIKQSHHKYMRHHDNWINQQDMAKHRVLEMQTKMAQDRYSEYDWQGNNQALKRTRKDILGDWEKAQARRRGKLWDVLGEQSRCQRTAN